MTSNASRYDTKNKFAIDSPLGQTSETASTVITMPAVVVISASGRSSTSSKRLFCEGASVVVSRFKMSPDPVMISNRRAANSYSRALLDGGVCDDASMRRFCGEDGGEDEGC